MFCSGPPRNAQQDYKTGDFIALVMHTKSQHHPRDVLPSDSSGLSSAHNSSRCSGPPKSTHHEHHPGDVAWALPTTKILSTQHEYVLPETSSTNHQHHPDVVVWTLLPMPWAFPPATTFLAMCRRLGDPAARNMSIIRVILPFLIICLGSNCRKIPAAEQEIKKPSP